MHRKHVAFILEQAYGHIIPTLGITLELLRRGHRVSYAVTDRFASSLIRIGAEVAVFDQLETRSPICQAAQTADGGYDFTGEPHLDSLIRDLGVRRTADSVSKLELAYSGNRPDIVIHDDDLDTTGRELALKWGIPKIRYNHCYLTKEDMRFFEEDDLIIVTVPKFMNQNPDSFEERFHFVGFIPEGRREFFEPWKFNTDAEKVIVASATTGLLPQVEFCKLMIDAFGNQPWRVILTPGGRHDPISEVKEDMFSSLPDNFTINRASSILEIVERACLFIGQGGQGSILEALYHGVPLLMIPSASFQEQLADHLEELGLARRLLAPDISAEGVRSAAVATLNDTEILQRVRQARHSMHEDRGAILAAGLIENRLLASGM